ncbi:uncharacterized protein LOC133915491 isoform X2 [Phragmites australis]|uniref:uncharacterized protein LOC133915491 isoform X2 n=1 Tax=Phragmites australis TaxID=29695 RepID=UPI002D769BCF|nr:uncharacterized protein LOC133915491 isoform X2 [Phragmites australis]
MTTAGEVDAAAAAGGEELEPLFDYKRVQPAMTFRFDDSDLEKADIFKHCNKRSKEGDKADEKAAKVVNVDEEDWLLPPPPKPAFRATADEDSALRELRLKKQELAKFAESAQEILQKLDETAKNEVGAKEPPEQIILEESEPQVEKAREKIIISIQDKDGQQQIRVYKDDKFDKLFKAYAKKAKLNPSDLTFVFDGDKINPSSTPEDLDLEDDDMIEVRHKGRKE